MRIGVHGRPLDDKTTESVQQIQDLLAKYGAEVYYTEEFDRELQAVHTPSGDNPLISLKDGVTPHGLDFMLSLGGDGTFLDTVAYVGAAETPILGINLGRLGFLATISKDTIDKALGDLAAGAYTLDHRSLIRLDSDNGLFGDHNFGLNEVAILKQDTSSMIVVHTYINGEYLNSYWADGLIVATPTGSTGYSLSCGGPVILPRSENFVVTPVSPHNLNVRPMVVSDDSVISFEIEGRSRNFLVAMDSRSQIADPKVQLAVRKEAFGANLVKLNGYNFLDTLRQKLNWGLDMRN